MFLLIYLQEANVVVGALVYFSWKSPNPFAPLVVHSGRCLHLRPPHGCRNRRHSANVARHCQIKLYIFRLSSFSLWPGHVRLVHTTSGQPPPPPIFFFSMTRVCVCVSETHTCESAEIIFFCQRIVCSPRKEEEEEELFAWLNSLCCGSSGSDA